jgi:enoyl-CoA hydratase/carnithine racemase
MTSKIIVDREGAVARIVFNRPQKRNALDREMYLAAVAALRAAAEDPLIAAVVLAGAGGAFTAGNDLADFRPPFDPREDFPALSFVRALAEFPKPLVAAVEGDAVGVGTTMLFHCDLVYAAPSARFRMPFVDLGLVPEAGSTLLAPRRFGCAKAAQFLLLGESFDAQEALRLNLVNDIAPAAQLFARACDAAGRLAQKPREALLQTRRLIRGDPAETRRRIDEEARLFFEALSRPELRARLDAFFAGGSG